jgi:hypothetical protein
MSRNLIEILRDARQDQAKIISDLLDSTCAICHKPKSACGCAEHVDELAAAFRFTRVRA